jgi:hypothetical protein
MHPDTKTAAAESAAFHRRRAKRSSYQIVDNRPRTDDDRSYLAWSKQILVNREN